MFLFFCFKQKTAYEMRISDWSSDVCSSDLAVTVAASLCALLVFPLAFLRSFAYAGVVVAFLAGAFSVVVRPAILAVLGRRVDALTIFRRSTTATDEGFWHRMALFVMRRPVIVATAAIAILLFLGDRKSTRLHSSH